MLRDLQARGWPLAVSLVEREGGGGPEAVKLNRICVVGTVQVCREYGDGRSDVLVHGLKRVRLLRFVQREPYLLMEAEVLPDASSAVPERVQGAGQGVGASGTRASRGTKRGVVLAPGSTAEGALSGERSEQGSFEELRSLIEAWFFLNPDVPDELSLLTRKFQASGELSDFFVSNFIRRLGLKQAYVDCFDPALRARKLIRHLRKDLSKQALRQLGERRGAALH
jgi:hypothetical protein